MKNSSKSLSFVPFFLLALIIIPAAIYFKSLNNHFIDTWDDNAYITENPTIKAFHGDSIVFSINYHFKNYLGGNYHPLTMLSYSMEYSKFKLDPKPYHITNLVLHLLNTLLVFCFIYLLSGKQLVAFITALLFAIHPMHVESVAWVSERKDVLYAFFYLAALCTYLIYTQEEKRKWLFYTFTCLFFLLGILSKAMTVSLPITFFVIDYYIDRKLSFKTILEKVPFLIASLIFGYIAIEAQKSINAMSDLLTFSFFDRFLFVSYGLMMYLWKLILPISLSSFYSYPKTGNESLPAIFYISPVIIFGLTFLIFKCKKTIFGKELWFGFGFFIITIALVLQILQVGGAILSERYTYLPYIGLFFVIGHSIHFILENKTEVTRPVKVLVLSAFFLFTMVCSYLTFQRCKVWHDSIRLWTDVIEKNAEYPRGYKARAESYYRAKQYEKAVEDYKFALQKYEYQEVYYHFGYAYYSLGKYEEAVKNLSIAIQYDTNDINAYLNRGNAYHELKKYKEAISDYTVAIVKRPKFSEAYNNRGLSYYFLKDYDYAINDYTAALQYNPKFSDAYSNRAGAYFGKGNFEVAIKDYTSAIELRHDFANAYNNRSRAYFANRQFQAAMDDITKTKELGQNVDPRFIEAVKRNIVNRQ